MCAFEIFFAIESGGVGVEEHFDIALFKHTFLHHFRGAEVGFAYDQEHIGCQIAKIEGFFACCVTAAYNCHALFAVEESIACGAGRDSET